MSKLLDRLDRLARGAPRTIGFSPKAPQESIPTLALLAWLGDASKPSVAEAASDKVDAFIVSESVFQGGKSGKRSKIKEGTILGVAVERPDRERVEASKGNGSDFIVFGLEGTPVDLLEDGDVARLLRVSSDLEESQIRGLEDLPVDAFLLQRPSLEGPLSLSHLLAISNIRSAVSRYLLLEWNEALTSRELEHLRDLGVDGLVVNMEQAETPVIATLRERIDQLPPRKPKGEQRSVVMLPHSAGTEQRLPHRHEEEEEDEEEELGEQ